MQLTLQSRIVGRVTIVTLSGRIIAGAECEALSAQMEHIFRDRKDVLLDLKDVGFVDSCGLGAMVRAQTSARRLHGDVKLCHVPEFVQKVLKMTNLDKLLESYDSEEAAVRAFHRLTAPWENIKTKGCSVLCVDSNNDVLAYLRELLRRSGYDVHTSSNLRDSLIVMRVACPGLLILGPDLQASPATLEAWHSACAKVPVIELGGHFSTLDAGEAAANLLQKIAAALSPGAAVVVATPGPAHS